MLKFWYIFKSSGAISRAHTGILNEKKKTGIKNGKTTTKLIKILVYIKKNCKIKQ